MKLDEAFLLQVEVIARAAGKAIMAVYACDFAINEKEDRSPLTEADMAAHILITQALQTLTPDIPILSEEAAENFSDPNAGQQFWLVDPLDGTKEFINKNGEFTVNIAFIEQGKPVLGIVYAPALDVLYSAAEGLGALKTDFSGAKARIQVARHIPGTPWKVTGSRSHAGDSLKEWLKTLGEYELILVGSSLKFCLVAEGKADLYPRFGPTSLWDTAAAQCVVEQAGGRVEQLNGQALSYGNLRSFLNPEFLVRGATASHVDPFVMGCPNVFKARHT